MCVAGKGHPPCVVTVLVGGKSEEEREERQKQIFFLSHKLGGDPEEVLLQRPQEALKRKLTHQQALPLLTLFSDNRQYSRSLRGRIKPYMRPGAFQRINP